MYRAVLKNNSQIDVLISKRIFTLKIQFYLKKLFTIFNYFDITYIVYVN